MRAGTGSKGKNRVILLEKKVTAASYLFQTQGQRDTTGCISTASGAGIWLSWLIAGPGELF